MPTEKQLLDALSKIQDDVGGGFIAASMVDLESGMTLAVKSVRSEFDLTAASAYNSELVKQKFKIMRTLGLNGSVEDMLITLSDQIHLIKLVNSSTFMYMAVDRKLCNLAIVRTAVNRQSEKLT